MDVGRKNRAEVNTQAYFVVCVLAATEMEFRVGWFGRGVRVAAHRHL